VLSRFSFPSPSPTALYPLSLHDALPILSIPDSIGVKIDPFPKIYHTAAGGEPMIIRQVPMPENKIVVRSLLVNRFGILNKPLSILTQKLLFFIIGDAAMLRPTAGNTNA